jgi:periplasmic nitrate reductase NapD
MDAIRALQGVLNAVLVYQHAEPADAMDEEIES